MVRTPALVLVLRSPPGIWLSSLADRMGRDIVPVRNPFADNNPVHVFVRPTGERLIESPHPPERGAMGEW